ncbi:MAG: acyl-CoA synthetase [Paracoccaceae bacterium]
MAHAHDLPPRTAANYTVLSPVSFIHRAAKVYPDYPAVIYGARRYSWAETYARSRRLASALRRAGLEKGDVVGVIAVNTPEIYEAHFGVPMAGCVLNTLNTRLDAGTIAYICDASDVKLLIADREFSATVREALCKVKNRPEVIDIVDPEGPDNGAMGETDYEAFLETGDPGFRWQHPGDEWDAISINYTSGTTGHPKGVIYHYRGAYINAVNNALEWQMPMHPVYLWTLPMFHCNGWCFPWTIAARAGTNICLRKVSGKAIYDAIADHGADHLCGAPIVLSFMMNATDEERRPFSHKCKVMTAAAPPPAAVLCGMQEQGFDVTHVYGLTETYGPAVVCAWHREWDALPIEEQALKKGRQGVAYLMEEEVVVMEPETMTEVPHDGETIGEIMFRGNIVLKGYLGDMEATDKALAGGYFHSGDLAVVQPDGYIQIKDRAKDIIISGGENISSIEVENAIFNHPAVQAVAVVARPDEKWGETPCAFVELKPGESATEEEIISICRERLAGYKMPKKVVFRELPKTSTGKIQKVLLREVAKAL